MNNSMRSNDASRVAMVCFVSKVWTYDLFASVLDMCKEFFEASCSRLFRMISE